MLQLKFHDVKWMNVYRRLLNHVVTNVARLKFMFEREYLSEDLRKLLRQPPIGGCSHKKGMGPYINPEVELLGASAKDFTRPIVTDYNMYLHTFAGGQQRIRCNRCGEAVWDNDPRFATWLKMFNEHSSNHASSAERVIEMTPEIAKALGLLRVRSGEPLVVYRDGIDLGKESSDEPRVHGYNSPAFSSGCGEESEQIS